MVDRERRRDLAWMFLAGSVSGAAFEFMWPGTFLVLGGLLTLISAWQLARENHSGGIER